MGSSRGAEVTVALRARLVLRDSTAPLPARLRYSADAPYAVRLVLDPGGGAPEERVLAREVLDRGTRGPAGEGDVRVRPSPAAGWLEVGLYSPVGHALVILPARDVLGFLRRAYAVVPAGLEGRHVDVDAAIDGILGGP